MICSCTVEGQGETEAYDIRQKLCKFWHRMPLWHGLVASSIPIEYWFCLSIMMTNLIMTRKKIKSLPTNVQGR